MYCFYFSHSVYGVTSIKYWMLSSLVAMIYKTLVQYFLALQSSVNFPLLHFFALLRLHEYLLCLQGHVVDIDFSLKITRLS